MRALAYAQQALDGRAPRDAFAEALLGATGADDRDALVQWSCDANQTIYARLAPIVFAHRDHPHAAALIAQAGEEIGKMIDALDPRHALPVALCGGLADALAPAVPARHGALAGAARRFRARRVATRAEGAGGRGRRIAGARGESPVIGAQTPVVRRAGRPDVKMAAPHRRARPSPPPCTKSSPPISTAPC
jgi:glucosamine kinase